MTFLSRYERFGWDYPLVNAPSERAFAWYRRHAREADGPVLEVPCGTGPLLAVLAADGHEVVGLDLSPSMLAQAHRRVATLPPEAASRVRLVEGDMRTFDLSPQTFALAIVADNSLREVETREDVLASLERIRRHLRPDGRLLVTERRFDPERYTGEFGPWSPPYANPETGETVRRRVRLWLSDDTRRAHGVMTYRIEAPDGSTRTEDFDFESPVLRPADYVALFDEAGFAGRLCVGYEDRADDGTDPVLCFVGRPRA